MKNYIKAKLRWKIFNIKWKIYKMINYFTIKKILKLKVKLEREKSKW